MPCIIYQPIEIFEVQFVRRRFDQKEPVPSPRHIPCDSSDARNVDGRALSMTVTRHVPNCYLSASVQLRRNNANRRFQPVQAGFDSSEVSERNYHADGSMPAHAQIADIVEEYDTRGTAWVFRCTQHGPNQGVRSARLIHDRGTKRVEAVAKSVAALSQTAAAQLRSALNYHSRCLAACMRVDHTNIHFGQQPLERELNPQCARTAFREEIR